LAINSKSQIVGQSIIDLNATFWQNLLFGKTNVWAAEDHAANDFIEA
jgi:hypothetical protein